jgi:hypothetical protein
VVIAVERESLRKHRRGELRVRKDARRVRPGVLAQTADNVPSSTIPSLSPDDAMSSASLESLFDVVANLTSVLFLSDLIC